MANSAAFSPKVIRRLTPHDRRAIWERGVILHDSPWSYAAPALLDEYQRLTAARPPQVVSPTDPGPSFLGGVASLLQAMKPSMDFLAEHREAWKRVLADTVARVVSGELLALGYAMPRQVEDAPVSVPQDVWGGKVDWNAGKLSGEGLEFVSVRIAAPEAMTMLLPLAGAAVDRPRLVGRPSSKAEVFAAYGALRDAGKVDFNGSMRQLYPEIRAWLSAAHPDRLGIFENLSDEAIRQVITDAFKADRASKKQ